eukprot:145018_1
MSGSENRWLTHRCVSTAEEMNPTRRTRMEDVHRVIHSFDNKENVSFFGVYDGHGGRGIVDFLETRLEQNIAAELRAGDDASIPERIRRAYLVTDIESKAAEMVTSGATAVTCILKRDGEEIVLYTSNIGDSRAVIFAGGKAIRLTKDHKADDEEEQRRVEKAGGFVLRSRVLGILAVARSFGDHGMKEFVIAEPHCNERKLNIPKEEPFFILACDGIWDVMTDEEACHVVNHELQEGNEDNAARKLVERALDRGSSDNITVLVVFR